MCGILGVFCSNKDELFSLLVLGIGYLERRGPDSFGTSLINPIRNTIITKKHSVDKSKIKTRSDELEEIVKRSTFFYSLKESCFDINARMILGQTRYSTDSRTVAEENIEQKKAMRYANAQPIHINFENYKGIFHQGVGVHNGNIPNKAKQKIIEIIDPKSDHLGNVDSRSLVELYMQKLREFKDDYFEAAKWIIENVNGSFSFIFSDGKNMVAFKDRWRVRPLCLGEKNGAKILISESGFFNDYGDIDFVKEVGPGEVVLIDQQGTLESKILDVRTYDGRCLFEPWYFLDYGSLCKDGQISVDNLRHKIGELTADYYEDTLDDIDLIVSFPRSGDGYARGFAYSSGKKKLEPVRKPHKKRHYLDARDSEDRSKNTGSHKYSIQEKDIAGLNLALVDDSIMRGDSIAKLYIELKKKGAKQINLYSMWPPNIFKCDKGNDTQTNEELIAYSLIEQGIIYQKDNGEYTYDSINKVNEAVTQITRQKIRELDPSVNPDDLQIFYAPMDIVRHKDVFPTGGCTLCLNGVDLEGWN